MTLRLQLEAFAGKGCNESYSMGYDTQSDATYLRKNEFCEGNTMPDANGTLLTFYEKYITSCDQVNKTFTLTTYACTGVGCKECSTEPEPSGTWVYPMSNWVDESDDDSSSGVNATPGQCWDVDILPPYDPSYGGMTELSYRYMNTSDPSDYIQLYLEGSCLGDVGGSTPASAPSSGSWIGVGVWSYAAFSSGYLMTMMM